ncbi:polyprenyl synthetase family protein [Natronoglycomyces albus]|uniref:Polyprenyl synthetase family protein n=1 Tax=Natronoglycomyces albus TaxID=2811108 RepID=A0A895XMQ1_9ACTN|nr:polyprenyl synthetase family protein [Natronoglycomyces albus]
MKFDDPNFEVSMQRSLQEVERRLSATVAGGGRLLDESADHLRQAGGKRFRPMLTLMCAHFGEPDNDAVYKAAVAVELTHLATLYHDDVMDEAPLRRGAPSANSRWSNSVAILTGDYLFACAAQTMADLGTEAVRQQAVTLSRLVQGQINETIGPDANSDPLEWHLNVLSEKTGSLIATSAQFGAWFSGAGPDIIEAVTEFGELIGIAFQLSDDIIDVESSSGRLGKAQGTDLMEGIPTLPVLFALRGTDPAEARLRELISQPVDEADLPETLEMLRASQGMRQAREVLNDYVARSRKRVHQLPEGGPRQALSGICDYLANRTS